MGGPSSDAPLTVLFTDVEASSEFYARLGDAAARDILGPHDLLIATTIDSYGGRIV